MFALPISMPRFKGITFYQYSPKIKLFLKKNAKFSSAGGSAPRPPNQPPQLRISGYVLSTLCIVYNRMGFRSFCFEQFFLHHSVANCMMLITDVCLMLNCFLFEKFYLHYALCDFDSILLHYAKLFIRQSIDREQIFDVTFEIRIRIYLFSRHFEKKIHEVKQISPLPKSKREQKISQCDKES